MTAENDPSTISDGPATALEAVDLHAGFPRSLAQEINRPVADLTACLDPAYKSGAVSVRVGDELIDIPQRVHLLTIPEFVDIRGEARAAIGNCILTRDCDGFVRQHGLNNIICLNLPWSIPYVMLLIGEYVFEILSIIHTNTHRLDRTLYKQFIVENPQLYDVIKQRVASYWDAYYRDRWPRRDSYVGFQIIDELDKW
jgi:hypothetical protein